MADARTSRRELLAWLAAVTASSTLGPFGSLGSLGCGSSSDGGGGGTQPPGTFFTDDERVTLGALADVILPPDASGPGGKDLGAVAFIERLVTALDQAEAHFYVSGPFSGRQPAADGTTPPNDFARWEALDRVQVASIRLLLFGSDAVVAQGGPAPNVAIVGAVTGLRPDLKTHLATARAAAGKPLDQLDAAAVKDVYGQLDGTFRETLIELVHQAAWAAPEYGGNPGAAGWKLVHFEGDSVPRGYTTWNDATKAYDERPEAPMSKANPGPDPAPMTDDVRAFIHKVVDATQGKVFY